MKRRDFLKGITAIGAISVAPKLIASEAERQLADSKILHNGPVRGIISKGDLTEESLGQLLDEIGDEPIAYNWSNDHSLIWLGDDRKVYGKPNKVEAGEDLRAGDPVTIKNNKAYKITKRRDEPNILITGIDENGNRCTEIIQIDADFVATTKNVYKSFELTDPTEGVKNITVRMAGSL